MLNSLQFIAAQARVLIPRNFSSVAVNPESEVAATNDEPVDMTNPFKKEKIECLLCKHKIEPDYKNTRLLAQFQSPYTGRIYGRHITGER